MTWARPRHVGSGTEHEPGRSTGSVLRREAGARRRGQHPAAGHCQVAPVDAEHGPASHVAQHARQRGTAGEGLGVDLPRRHVGVDRVEHPRRREQLVDDVGQRPRTERQGPDGESEQEVDGEVGLPGPGEEVRGERALRRRPHRSGQAGAAPLEPRDRTSQGRLVDRVRGDRRVEERGVEDEATGPPQIRRLARQAVPLLDPGAQRRVDQAADHVDPAGGVAQPPPRHLRRRGDAGTVRPGRGGEGGGDEVRGLTVRVAVERQRECAEPQHLAPRPVGDRHRGFGEEGLHRARRRHDLAEAAELVQHGPQPPRQRAGPAEAGEEPGLVDAHLSPLPPTA